MRFEIRPKFWFCPCCACVCVIIPPKTNFQNDTEAEQWRMQASAQNGNGRIELILSAHALQMMLALLALFSTAAFAQNPSALNPTNDQLWTPNPELKYVEDDFRKVDKNGSPVDPKQFIPPKPFAPNWHKETTPIEMAYEVLWIKFDHEYGDAHDGINVRWSDRHDLKHAGHGAGHGEYYNPDSSAPQRYSEPVLYRNGTEASPVRPKFQVHIKAKDPVTLDPFTLLRSADIRVKAHHSDAVDRSHNDELGVPPGLHPQSQAVVFQSMFAAVGAAQSYTFTITPRGR